MKSSARPIRSSPRASASSRRGRCRCSPTRATDHVLDPADIEKNITERTKAHHRRPSLRDHRRHGPDPRDRPAAQPVRHRGLRPGARRRIQGKKAGTVGHAGCFSFCQSKHFTTGGEGGSGHHRRRGSGLAVQVLPRPRVRRKKRLNLLELEAKLMYIHSRVGFNYRMTEVQSAIGLAELERFESWNLPARRRNGRLIIEALKNHPLVLHTPARYRGAEKRLLVVPAGHRCRTNSSARPRISSPPSTPRACPPTASTGRRCTRKSPTCDRNGFGVANYPFRGPESAAHRLFRGQLPDGPLAHRPDDLVFHPPGLQRKARAVDDRGLP